MPLEDAGAVEHEKRATIAPNAITRCSPGHNDHSGHRGALFKMTAAKVRLALEVMGQKEKESDWIMQRTGYDPTNTLPACRAGGHATDGRVKSR